MSKRFFFTRKKKARRSKNRSRRGGALKDYTSPSGWFPRYDKKAPNPTPQEKKDDKVPPLLTTDPENLKIATETNRKINERDRNTNTTTSYAERQKMIADAINKNEKDRSVWSFLPKIDVRRKDPKSQFKDPREDPNYQDPKFGKKNNN